jgi:hypothetical protein
MHTCSVLMSSLPITVLFEELQIRTFKRYFTHEILLITLHLRKMN